MCMAPDVHLGMNIWQRLRGVGTIYDVVVMPTGSSEIHIRGTSGSLQDHVFPLDVHAAVEDVLCDAKHALDLESVNSRAS